MQGGSSRDGGAVGGDNISAAGTRRGLNHSSVCVCGVPVVTLDHLSGSRQGPVQGGVAKKPINNISPCPFSFSSLSRQTFNIFLSLHFQVTIVKTSGGNTATTSLVGAVAATAMATAEVCLP